MSKRHTWLNRCGHAADRRLSWFAEPELSLHTWCCHKRCHRPPNNCGPHGMPAGKTIVTRAHGPPNLLIFSSSGPTNTHRPPAAKKTVARASVKVTHTTSRTTRSLVCISPSQRSPLLEGIYSHKRVGGGSSFTHPCARRKTCRINMFARCCIANCDGSHASSARAPPSQGVTRASFHSNTAQRRCRGRLSCRLADRFYAPLFDALLPFVASWGLGIAHGVGWLCITRYGPKARQLSVTDSD